MIEFDWPLLCFITFRLIRLYAFHAAANSERGSRRMTTVGWILLALIAAVLVKNLAASGSLKTTLGKNTLIAAIITVNVMSALDAFSTIYLVSHDYSAEMNPVMSALIEYDYVAFFLVKMLLTLIATLTCWHYYERKRRARTILKLTSHVYSVLLAWHCLLLSSVLL